MNLHPLVIQLQFSRNEFMRCLDGISPEDAVHRIEPMNCLSWIIGHLANQEQRYWIQFAQGRTVVPELYDLVGYGKPATTPQLSDMLEAWRQVTEAADNYLMKLNVEQLKMYFEKDGEPLSENIGTLLHRNIYHYWFHTGEAHAIRQMLGHRDLPEFVGNMSSAFYK